MSQVDLAQRLALRTQAHMSLLERGHSEPSIERVLQIADLFGVSTDYLLRVDIPTAGCLCRSQAGISLLRLNWCSRISMKQTIVGAIRITRPLNCLSALIVTVLGGYLGSELLVQVWIAGIVAAVLTAAGNVVNDYFDLNIDRINKPLRPLPSGQLSPNIAVGWAIALVILGIALSLSLGSLMALIATLMALLLYVYSWRLKSSFLLGNAVVSIMSATTIVYGGIAVHQIKHTLAPALLILLFMFCREILKTVEDYAGDHLAGAQTIAVVWGKTATLRVFGALAIIVAIVAWLPWAFGDVSAAYLLLMVPTLDTVLLVGAFLLMYRPTQPLIRKVLAATKANWILWLIAMFIGASITI